MGEDRLPKFFHFDALSQPVEAASLSVFHTAFKLLSGVLYLLPLQVNNSYITFFMLKLLVWFLFPHQTLINIPDCLQKQSPRQKAFLGVVCGGMQS